MTPQKTSLLNFRIPNTLKHDFHTMCVQNRTCMTSELVRMIKEYLHREIVDQHAYDYAQKKHSTEKSLTTDNSHGNFIKDPNTDVWTETQ